MAIGVSALLAFAAAPCYAAGAAAGATFSGTVTTAADGAPAGHVCVVAVNTADSTAAGSTVTADDGTYSVTVPAGTYWLKYDDCRGGDLIEQYWKGVAYVGDATRLSVADGTSMTGMDVALKQGGAISGRVTDTDGNPLSASVYAASVDQNWSAAPPVSGQTAPDGSFTVHGVSPAAYQLSFTVASAGFPHWYDGDVRELKDAPALSVSAGATTSGVDVHVPHSATVTGTVTGDDGSPFAGACVGVFYSDVAVAPLQTQSASDGSYSVPNVAPGAARVKFSDCSGVTAAQWYHGAPDYASATPVDLAQGSTASSIDGVVSRGLSISGSVVDENNQPVANAIVDVYDALTGVYTGRGVWTDAAGHYVIGGLRGATYKLLFRPYQGMVARWWPASPTKATALPLVLTAGVSLSNIDVVVPHGATVSGTIVDEAGQAVKGVCVQPVGGIGDQAPGNAVTDDAGHYTTTGLDTGTYAFELSSCTSTAVVARSWLGGTDMRSTATSLALSLQQVVTGVDGVAHPGGGITGTVTDTSGHPIANIWVHAEVPVINQLTSTADAFTDSTGHYAFHELWPRTDYRLRFDDPYTGNYASSYLGGPDFDTATPVTVTAGGDTGGNDVVLYRAGFLTGTVIDQFGKRVARVGVSAVRNNHWSAPVFTDDTGSFRIGGLLPGTYAVSYSDQGAGLFPDPVSGAYTTSNSGATFDVTEGNTTTVPQAQVTVITTPDVPLSVRAVAGDASAVVSWVAPADTGHAPLTAFHVRMAGQVVATASGSSHSVVVPHLANYRNYTLTVEAVNLKGAGKPSASVAVVPKPAATLTLTRRPATLTYGGSVALTGRLSVRATGAALARRVVSLYRRAHGASTWTVVTSTHTTSTGHYAFTARPLRATDYRVSYAGSRGLLPAAATRTVVVRPRLDFARQGKSLVAVVVPALAGQRLGLQRYARRTWQTVGWQPLSRTGHAVFSLTRVGTFRVYLPATSRLAAAWSSRISVSAL